VLHDTAEAAAEEHGAALSDATTDLEGDLPECRLGV